MRNTLAVPNLAPAPPATAPPAEPAQRAWTRAHGSPLLVIDCAQVRRQFRSLAAALPGVELHYAVKALPHPAVLATLDDEGSSFDVCSAGEIDLLAALGADPRRVIHTHPIKRDRDIRDALDFGCSTFVFDNAAELSKLVPYRDRVSLMLRIGFRSADAVVDLSKKFGCEPDGARGLLMLARDQGLPVRGLSFHVGSQCRSSAAHAGAIAACGALIAAARREGVASLDRLDIGGGFPVPYSGDTPGIDAFCAPIRQALAGLPAGLRLLAEPGRFLAGPAAASVATVVGKAWRGGRFWYYLDDGVYGAFSGQIYDGVRYPLAVISDEATGPRHRSVLAGPTCDSVDIIAEEILLPELQPGDLVIGSLMGAYTLASASGFNSLARPKVLVLAGPSPHRLRGVVGAG